MTGTVYLVGAGPGAPDLLTLRAARLLERAQIVLHDALVHPDTLALARQAIWVDVGKRSGGRATVQAFINKRLVDAARKHTVVVRLKGGDPMLFGRANEEIAALIAADIAYEIVPGISAAFGAAAEYGLPLTERGVGRSLTFVTPRTAPGSDDSSWIDAVRAADSAVLYMARDAGATVAARLIERGTAATEPVAVVASATWDASEARFGILTDLAMLTEGLDGPALVIVGTAARKSAHCADTTAWRRVIDSRHSMLDSTRTPTDVSTYRRSNTG